MWLALIAAAPAEDVAPKIINGAEATVDEWPSAGAILVDAGGVVGFQCSSSLIAPDVVILAAHCIDPSLLGVSSFDGVGWNRSPDLTSVEAADLAEPTVWGADWVFHDEWDLAALQTGLALNYDVGLLFLEEAQTDIPLAWLPTAEDAVQIVEGVEVSVVGWGMDDGADSASYGIKHGGPSTVDALADYEFQVGAATDAVRKCHGDSGGPTFLVVDTPASIKERMIGVTSHTWDETDCMETGGVDTRVDYYLDWIDAEMVSRCEDGSRVWCDLPGILPPPIPMSEAELLADLRLVGCHSSGGTPAGLLVVAGLLAVGRRRGRSEAGHFGRAEGEEGEEDRGYSGGVRG